MFGLPEAIATKVLMQRYLECTEDRKADRLLDELIAKHAAPLIRGVVARKIMDEQEKESVAAIANAQLVEKLTALRQDRASGQIRDLPAYVRQVARRAFGDFLEEKQPERRRLKARLQFFVKSQDLIAIWQEECGDIVCGLAKWRDQGMRAGSSARRAKLEEDPDAAAHAAMAQGSPRSCKLGALIGSLLLWVGGPIPVEILTSAIAQIQCLTEPIRAPAAVGDDTPAPDAYGQAADTSKDIESRMQMRAHLELVWKAICTLTVKQRSVLLLSLQDAGGGSGLLLLPTLHIAYHKDIADALEMPYDEFVRVWRELPLGDKRIAEMLKIEPGNVRFQRSDARRRLHLQMRALDV